jgi:hypothetical protein
VAVVVRILTIQTALVVLEVVVLVALMLTQEMVETAQPI